MSLYVVWIATYSISCFCIITFSFILTLRTARTVGAAKKRAFISQWRPVLTQCLTTYPEALPLLKRHERRLFLHLWVTFQESVTGEAHARLKRLARELDLHKIALTYTRPHRGDLALLAVTALGHLQESHAWETLAQLLSHSNRTLSLAAARALVRIDTVRGLSLVLPFLATRQDWSVLNTSLVLKEIGQSISAPLLAQQALSRSSDVAARLITLIKAIRGLSALPLVRKLIERHPNDVTIVCAALDLFSECHDPRDLPQIRHYTLHSNWIIRLHAAMALGKMGTLDDEIRLMALLSDSEWWVRYRAAESLSGLPVMTRRRLAELAEAVPDKSNADLIAHFVHHADFYHRNARCPSLA